jgi:hypothetical protein
MKKLLFVLVAGAFLVVGANAHFAGDAEHPDPTSIQFAGDAEHPDPTSVLLAGDAEHPDPTSFSHLV